LSGRDSGKHVVGPMVTKSRLERKRSSEILLSVVGWLIFEISFIFFKKYSINIDIYICICTHLYEHTYTHYYYEHLQKTAYQ
jgi:hypothetical protein